MQDVEVNEQLSHFDDHAGVLEGCIFIHFHIFDSFLFFALTGLHTACYYKPAGFAVLCPA